MPAAEKQSQALDYLLANANQSLEANLACPVFGGLNPFPANPTARRTIAEDIGGTLAAMRDTPVMLEDECTRGSSLGALTCTFALKVKQGELVYSRNYRFEVDGVTGTLSGLECIDLP